MQIASGTLLLGASILCFLSSKSNWKRFFRTLVREHTVEDEDYRMMRALLAGVVAGAFFLFFAAWGMVRVLDIAVWARLLAS
ncbi:hypothetical protein CH340_01200 [Rhodoplanes serenus]|nr:hypothetical protein CH340_01200 [Rhodoplanes serenus]